MAIRMIIVSSTMKKHATRIHAANSLVLIVVFDSFVSWAGSSVGDSVDFKSSH